MAPDTPNARSAPAELGALLDYALGLVAETARNAASSSPNARSAAAKRWRSSNPRYSDGLRA